MFYGGLVHLPNNTMSDGECILRLIIRTHARTHARSRAHVYKYACACIIIYIHTRTSAIEWACIDVHTQTH